MAAIDVAHVTTLRFIWWSFVAVLLYINKYENRINYP